MCTVTFLPAAGGYVLATNRDESHARGPGLPPARLADGVLAPRDTDAGGTWIAVDDRGRAVCLLNGDARPSSELPAGPSRGLLVPELMRDAHPDAVREQLAGRARRGELRFRPFKLLVAAPTEPSVLRADWDGEQLAFAALCGPCVTVSSTFDRDEVARRRAAAFDRFVARHHAGEVPPGADALVDAVGAWHAGHDPGEPHGDAYSVCMHRADARTVSYTAVTVDATRVRMDYLAGWPCRGGPLHTAELRRR